MRNRLKNENCRFLSDSLCLIFLAFDHLGLGDRAYGTSNQVYS